MTECTLHPRKQVLFAALSVADFALTWWLIERSEARAYEANPIAGWWLAQFGWIGLACFKLAVVCLILGLASLISRFRPLTAGRVLRLGCACLAAVVLYSVALGGRACWASEETTACHNAELEATNREVLDYHRARDSMRTLLAQLEREILAERHTLPQAAAQLQEHQGTDPDRLRTLELNYPDVPLEQRFACWIITRLMAPRAKDSVATRLLAGRLEGEFRSGYGVPTPPSLHRQTGKIFPLPGEPTEEVWPASQDGGELAQLP